MLSTEAIHAYASALRRSADLAAGLILIIGGAIIIAFASLL